MSQAFSIAGPDTSLSPGAATLIPLCITGVINISKHKDDILIQPNPVENIINIELSERLKIELVSIFDVLGNLILKQAKSNRFDVSGLKPGIYLLSVETENKLYRKKFVKK